MANRTDVRGALRHVPVDKNPLGKARFRFVMQRAPHVEFFSQHVNIPAISTQTVDQPTPFVSVPRQGDHLSYDPLILTFLVDENLENYIEIHSWLTGITFPNEFDEYRSLATQDKIMGEGLESQISIFILNSNMNPYMEVIFRDASPVSLTQLDLDSTLTDEEYLEATAAFQYTSYSFRKVT